MRITDYPDLLRTKGAEPMPQAWDADKQDWTPAIDSAATLEQIKTAMTDGTQKVALTGTLTDGAIDSLGARADVAQTDTTQAATAIALLKGLIELGKTVGTENTLQLIQTALGGLNEKDFATQATLAQVLTKLGDLSTATNQEAVKLVLDAISNAVATRATELTLGEIKTALTDGTQKVQLTGNFDTLRTPAVGRRTVTATAAELFAGASRLASRRRLVIRNEDPVLRCLIGPATVSQQTGFPIEPGAVLEVPCDPEVAVPVYAISEGASLTVAVMEI